MSLYLSTANKPSPKVIHRLARAFWIKGTIYVIKILFPESTELRVRGLCYNVYMNTFDENPFSVPRHTCQNCWERVAMVFTFGDGFLRCLYCHQNAREQYVVGVSTTEEDWF